MQSAHVSMQVASLYRTRAGLGSVVRQDCHAKAARAKYPGALQKVLCRCVTGPGEKHFFGLHVLFSDYRLLEKQYICYMLPSNIQKQTVTAVTQLHASSSLWHAETLGGLNRPAT